MSMVVGKRSEIKHSLISASFLEKIRFRSFDSCREWSVSMVVRECSEIKNSLRSTFFFWGKDVVAASIIVGSRVLRWP